MIKYSICMCNYNMAKTLDVALRSVLDQLDERFEVVLVDDGSSDESVDVIKKLQGEYPALRLVELQRDSKRQLGFTRNISVENAQGEYVLLHLDCDDITAPHIIDFTEVFHQIESCFDHDILLSGLPIQMGKREFLLKHGPYRNIHRGEDRDMLVRLAAVNAYIPLHSQSFKTRLPKDNKDRFYRTFYYSFDALRNAFRAGQSLSGFIYDEIFYQRSLTPRTRLLRFMLLVPAWLRAKMQGPLPGADMIRNHTELQAYRAKMGGSFEKIMKDYGKEPDWSKLSEAGRPVFDI